jgi:Protein of unknown function (DUF3592)
MNGDGLQTQLAASLNADDKLSIEALLTITVVLFALGFWIRYKEAAVRKWPQSSGVIVASNSDQQYVGQGRKETFPVIEYEFNYEGQSFKTSHWRFGNFSIGNSIDAGAILSRYPVGSTVTVFVNPRQPMKSVLEANPSALCWVPFGFGIFFLAITTLVILAITQN